MKYHTRHRIAFTLVILLFFGVIAAALLDHPTWALLCVFGLGIVAWAAGDPWP